MNRHKSSPESLTRKGAPRKRQAGGGRKSMGRTTRIQIHCTPEHAEKWWKWVKQVTMNECGSDGFALMVETLIDPK